MTREEQQSEERQQAINKLRETLKPGDTVYTILRHVSRSGMQREISLMIAGQGGEILDITYAAAKAMNDRVGNYSGIVAGGCGMDMGFELVYNLGRTLWSKGYGCVGDKCSSNDHSNGDRDRTPHYPDTTRFVGYRENGTIESAIGTWGEYQPQGHREFRLFNSEAFLYLFDDEIKFDKPMPQHWHTDGGYALQQRWL